MTELRKESLSALIDGEATELEVHRLVREFRQDDGLAGSWAAYQHIRTTIRSGGAGFSPADHEGLFSRISEAIDAEETHSQIPAAPASSKKVMNVMFGSLALAASLVVAVFIGVQQPNVESPAAVAAAPAMQTPILAAQPVASMSPVAEDDQTSELVELDEEKQRLLRNYLNQHDRMSRLNIDRQLVNYQESTGK